MGNGEQEQGTGGGNGWLIFLRTRKNNENGEWNGMKEHFFQETLFGQSILHGKTLLQHIQKRHKK